MRIYFIFSIKEDVYELYKDYPKALYNIFLEIYEMNKKDIEYGYSLFTQMANGINKQQLDNQICKNLKDKLRYSKNKDEHIINNLYSEEVSLMKIKHTHITINTIQSYTEFFELLSKYEPFLFACDFKNDDYFFLSKIKMLV
jgi:hypothetical protein